MNLKLKIAANTLAQIIGKIISAGTTFLITILVARKFGPEGYGDLEKILSFTAIFYLIADFGFNAIAISEIKKNPTQKDEIFGLVFFLRFILGILLIFLTLALLSFLPSAQNQGFTSYVRLGIIIASGTILTQALFTTSNLLFQESLRYDKSVISTSISYILNLLLVFLVIRLNLPLLFVVASYLLSGILQVIISFSLAKPYLHTIRFFINKDKIFSLIQKTLPLGITLVFNVIYFRSDIILLAAIRPTQEVAYYGLAYRFFEVALVFPTFFMNALYPILLEAKNKTDQNLKHIFFTSAGFLAGVGLVIAIVLVLLAPFLIGLTSSSFQESILPLRILSLSLPIFYLTSLLMWVLVSYEMQKLLAPIYGITMVINILLNLIFIPSYGYLASSIITGLTELLILIFLTFAIKKELAKQQFNHLTI